MEEKLEKVRAEIERRKKEVEDNIFELGNFESERMGLFDNKEIYNDLLSFIDSMQEECNITGIKSKHATGKLKESIDNQTEEGLEQARKQLEENPQECMYARDNYTDEDRKALCDGCDEECKFNKKEEPVSEDFEAEWKEYFKYRGDIATVNIKDLAKHFANWQKQKNESKVLTEEQCRKIRDDAFELGKDAMKQQMMAKAVDAVVKVDAGGYPYIPQMELYDYGKDIPLAKEGDKYKVILIK